MKPHALYLTLPRRLDAEAVRRLPPPDTHCPPSVILLDGASVEEIDPVGAAQLWDLCRRTGGATTTAIRLLGLPAHLRRRLRHHPLGQLLVSQEDEVFADVTRDGEPSER